MNGIIHSSWIEIIFLLGFQSPYNIRYLIFFLFLVIFCLTICGNLLIITLVSHSKSLHSPMYFFLSQLSISDILLISDILPNTLHAVLLKETILSFAGCITQLYFFALSETSECLLLIVMSYDRYLAVCRPLHYSLAMNFQFCGKLIITCWILSVFTGLIVIFTIVQLKFCGPNVIDHFFCDLVPIIQLSCSDITNLVLETTILNFVFAVIPFCIIIVSYVYIIVTIFKIPSITGRQKVFSTCSSHLTVVCIFYGTIVCVYLVPSKVDSWNFSKFLSLLYTAGTPLVNPMIYSLRNKDLKNAVVKIFNHDLGLLLGQYKNVY
uniref:Olfactory receptor n=1 Tax=Pyxicephalus adspersus TaxID=30357 RepID=A0AAV3B4G5_PYXAD|nr:TPA: hypothetical protein GDO54_005843 [Pyxicephalus adspersus]